MRQKEAVYAAVLEALDEISGPVTLTKDQRKDVIDAITTGITTGEVEFSDEARAKYSTEAQIRNYVSGLVNNWLRKDTRLNGGTKHEVKNPGSRAGQGDEQLKAMRALRKQLSIVGDVAKVAEVDLAIARRIEEVKATRKLATPKTPAVDLSNVPDELKAALGIAS